MENIENIKNNLSNICYLYDLYRFPDMEDFLTLEYVDDVDPEELQDTLNDYFIAMTWDIPETWGLLDLIGKETLARSIQAFKNVSEISIDSEAHLISFKYDFLSSVDRANEAIKLLENGHIKEFKSRFPQYSEQNLYTETDRLVLIIQHLNYLIPIERDE
jgi:hypothetical protein